MRASDVLNDCPMRTYNVVKLRMGKIESLCS
jgi:hypothetical protein